MTVTYTPIWEDDEEIVPFPGPLKKEGKLRSKYLLAKSIINSKLEELDDAHFKAMAWDKKDIDEQRRRARTDLRRYHTALFEMGTNNYDQ